MQIRMLAVLSIIFGLFACSPTEENEDKVREGLYFLVNGKSFPLDSETLAEACYSEVGDDWAIQIEVTEAASENLLKLTAKNIGSDLTLNYGEDELFSSQILEGIESPGNLGMFLQGISQPQLFEMFAPIVDKFSLCGEGEN